MVDRDEHGSESTSKHTSWVSPTGPTAQLETAEPPTFKGELNPRGSGYQSLPAVAPGGP
jgi:hypothetical protein